MKYKVMENKTYIGSKNLPLEREYKFLESIPPSWYEEMKNWSREEDNLNGLQITLSDNTGINILVALENQPCMSGEIEYMELEFRGLLGKDSEIENSTIKLSENVLPILHCKIDNKAVSIFLKCSEDKMFRNIITNTLKPALISQFEEVVMTNIFSEIGDINFTSSRVINCREDIEEFLNISVKNICSKQLTIKDFLLED